MAVLVLSAWGCGPQDLYTGVWRSEEAAAEGSVLVGHIELTAAQFGDDVAGMIKLYSDPLFKVPLDSCPCLFIMRGAVGGRSLSFVVDLSTCPALQPVTGTDLLVIFDPDGARRIRGRLLTLDGQQVLQELSLERVLDNLDLVPDAELLRCPEPGAGTAE